MASIAILLGTVALLILGVDSFRVHKVSAAPEGKIATIAGTVVAEDTSAVLVSSASRDQGPGNIGPKMYLDWSTQFKYDVVLWDELVKDEVVVDSCSDVFITFAGNRLHEEDFYPSVVFVINRDHWTSTCGRAIPHAPIPEEDDVLFFEVSTASYETTGGGVRVHIGGQLIDGSKVAPEVTMSLRHDAVGADEQIGDVEVLVGTSSETCAASESTGGLPRLKRGVGFEKRLEGDVDLYEGLKLNYDTSLSGGIRNFKLKRLRKLAFQWDQDLSASVQLAIHANVAIQGDLSGLIIQQPIPDLGFSARVPIVGRAMMGAYVKLDWVADAEIRAEAQIKTEAIYEIQQTATASFISRTYSTTNHNLDNPSTPRGDIHLDIKGEAAIKGFVGVRPAVGVGVTLGKRGVDANAGFSVGIELESELRSTSNPFNIVTSGLFFGTCDKCHKMEGVLYAKIKNLGFQTMLGVEEKETVLVPDIYHKDLMKFCVFPAACQKAADNLSLLPDELCI